MFDPVSSHLITLYNDERTYSCKIPLGVYGGDHRPKYSETSLLLNRWHFWFVTTVGGFFRDTCCGCCLLGGRHTPGLHVLLPLTWGAGSPMGIVHWLPRLDRCSLLSQAPCFKTHPKCVRTNKHKCTVSTMLIGPPKNIKPVGVRRAELEVILLDCFSLSCVVEYRGVLKNQRH